MSYLHPRTRLTLTTFLITGTPCLMHNIFWERKQVQNDTFVNIAYTENPKDPATCPHTKKEPHDEISYSLKEHSNQLLYSNGVEAKKKYTPCQAPAFDNLPWNKALRGNQLIFDARIICNVFKPLIKGHVTEFSSPTSQSVRKEEMQSTSFSQIAPHLC